MRQVPRQARSPLSIAITLALGLGSFSASYAFEFDNGGYRGSIDTTLTFGQLSRVQGQDPDLICLANGGNGFSCNIDNGNLNYDTGTVSEKMQITSDIEINSKSGDWGAFFRIKAFTDNENSSTSDGARTPLPQDTVDLIGEDADVLDAYVWKQFKLSGRNAEIRFGDQVVSWGESTFIPNGINAINPVNVGALRSPGSELRDALLPVTLFSLSTDVTDNLSTEMFYQLDWERVYPDPSGSFFSVNDAATDGGSHFFLGSGSTTDLAITTASAVPRGGDNDARDSGQYGLAFRLFVPELNDTEFGFYYMKYHSRLPIISAVTGSNVGVAAIATYPSTARYFLEYPEDIKLYGFSFNTNAGSWALQGEISHRKDVPLQIDDNEILFAALGARNQIIPFVAAFNSLANNNQVGAFGLNAYIPGFITRDVTQWQVTATKLFSNVFGANEGVFVGEIAYTHVHNMPKKSELRLNGPGTALSGNAILGAFAHGTGNGTIEDERHFADANSWGFRLAGSLTYNNAIGPINLKPSFGYQHDVSGTSPGPGGNFVEGRQALTLGLGASYKNQWSADMSYTSYFGAGDHNLLNDRDFISFNIKYSF